MFCFREWCRPKLFASEGARPPPPVATSHREPFDQPAHDMATSLPQPRRGSFGFDWSARQPNLVTLRAACLVRRPLPSVSPPMRRRPPEDQTGVVCSYFGRRLHNGNSLSRTDAIGHCALWPLVLGPRQSRSSGASIGRELHVSVYIYLRRGKGCIAAGFSRQARRAIGMRSGVGGAGDASYDLTADALRRGPMRAPPHRIHPGKVVLAQARALGLLRLASAQPLAFDEGHSVTAPV